MQHTAVTQSTSTNRGVFSRLTDSSTFTGTHKSVTTRLERERKRTAAAAKASLASTMMDQADIDAVIGGHGPQRGAAEAHARYNVSTPFARASGGSEHHTPPGGGGGRLQGSGSGRSPRDRPYRSLQPVASSASTSGSSYKGGYSHSSLSSAGTSSLVTPLTPRSRPSRHRRVSMTQAEKDSERRSRLTALVLADYGNDGDSDAEEQRQMQLSLQQQEGTPGPPGGAGQHFGSMRPSAAAEAAAADSSTRPSSVAQSLRSLGRAHVRAGRTLIQVSPVQR